MSNHSRMALPSKLACGISRREVLYALRSGPALSMLAPLLTALEGKAKMTVTCFIRYQIDPFQREAFVKYAQTWGRIIPRCGGHLLGYFLPYEGTNDVAWGLIAFESLAAYETYRARLRLDAEARANFGFAQTNKFVLREERTFLEVATGTLNLPSTFGRKD